MRRFRIPTLSILVLTSFANANPQAGDASQEAVTTISDDQEGTVTVYGNGSAAETSSGALVTRTSDETFFALPKPTSSSDSRPLGPRNPFLLREEQDAGMSRAALLEARASDEAARLALLSEAERAAVVQSQSTVISDSERERTSRLAALRARIESMRACAVLLSESGSRAVIDGNVIRIGDSLIEGQVRVDAIDREGVHVSSSEDRWTIALAAVGSMMRDVNGNVASPKSDTEGNENP